MIVIVMIVAVTVVWMFVRGGDDRWQQPDNQKFRPTRSGGAFHIHQQ